MTQLFYALMIISFLVNFKIFWNLSDFSQLLNIREFPRSTFMNTWYQRNFLRWLAIICMLSAISLNLYFEIASMWYTLPVFFVGALLQYAGLTNPKFMMPAQQHQAKFVGLHEASKVIRPHNEVMVIVNNGHARAHVDFEMWRPHIAGNAKGLGGEDIIMTYCSLSNLGMAYRPSIDGVKLDLKVATQLENNLLMVDAKTGEPVQQITGNRECNVDSPMQEFPSFKMSFGDFCKAYPEGEVFVTPRPSVFPNPIFWFHEIIMDGLFYLHVNKQRHNDDFLFQTLKNFDPDKRVHRKEHVWAVSINGENVCYTQDFIKSNDGINTVTIGGREIVIAYDQQFDSIGMWYNDTSKAVTKVDFHGVSNNGLLKRVESMKAGVFYGVWYNFFPDTLVNK